MRTVVSNQLKMRDVSVPMKRTDTLLRKSLEMLIVDIADKLGSLPTEQVAGLALEWRLVGFDADEMKGEVKHEEDSETIR